MLEVNSIAPNFSLVSEAGEEVTLKSFPGKKIVLVFYPADWSPVCGDQVSLYNEMLMLFEKYNVQLIGISVDGMWSHSAFSLSRNLDYPLLSDFEPKGEVSKLYQVYNQKQGMSHRALYIIDENGVVKWSKKYEDSENPGGDVILEELEKLQG